MFSAKKQYTLINIRFEFTVYGYKVSSVTTTKYDDNIIVFLIKKRKKPENGSKRIKWK